MSLKYKKIYFLLKKDVIGNSKDASPEDYKKICSIYKCNKCMGKKFKPLKNRRR